MLAYVFWHSPSESADRNEYEALLAGFHARLREMPPPGFRESVAFAVDTPWGGAGYEDWYLVEDWSSLGVLNASAVDSERGPRHDPVAGLAAKGAGGVYATRRGALPIATAGSASWSSKPLGQPYGDFETAATAGRDPSAYALWQRQLVLGPAPEFCLFTGGDGLRRVA